MEILKIMILIILIILSLLGCSLYLTKEHNKTIEKICSLQTDIITLKKDIVETEVIYEKTVEFSTFYCVIKKVTKHLTDSETIIITKAIVEASTKNKLDPLLLIAVIDVESSFRISAKSFMGARGLMQVMPVTGLQVANELGIPWRGSVTLNNPRFNILIGSYYLAKLITYYENIDQALIAYNQGPARLNSQIRKGKIPKRYLTKVLKTLEKHKKQIV